MDYKKLIKSRDLRLAILKMLSFIPDKLMISLQYRIKTGRRLNLKEPKRYTEKLQWYKLYYKDPAMTRCVDKYDVRAYVEEKGLGHILNECYGVFDTVEEIDFSKLPQQFVLKDTLGGGGNSVILVEDKKTVFWKALYSELQYWVDEPSTLKHPGREWVYDKKKHRIIAEKMLFCPQSGDLPDYKFFCFDGKVHFYYVRTGYAFNHGSGELAFFDRDGNCLQGIGMDYCATAENSLVHGAYMDEMIDYAEILAKDFPHVRVDFYHINGKTIFGELTFFNASGYMKFEPDSFDFEMGEKFVLPLKRKK